jgi:hypothetical protein
MEEEERERVVALYRLRFTGADADANEIGEEPVYLILAMNKDRVLRMKPQNLAVGLPLRHMEAAS